MGARDTIGMIPNFGCKLAANFKTRLMKPDEFKIAIREEDVELILRKLDKIKNMLEHKALSKGMNIQRNYFLETNRAADYLDISRSQLYKLTSTGQLQYTKVGGRRKFSIQDLDNYLKGDFYPSVKSII